MIGQRNSSVRDIAGIGIRRITAVRRSDVRCSHLSYHRVELGQSEEKVRDEKNVV